MSIVRCKNGHYYDDEKYASCPHCGSESGESAGVFDSDAFGINDDEKTSAFIEPGSEDITLGYSDIGEFQDDDRTVGFFERRMDVDPVVGWLVCTEGPELGRDYRLHAGRNYLGRSNDMDVAIPDDDTISSRAHLQIVFDPKDGSYMAAPGMGTISTINGEPLRQAQDLDDGDVIGVGASTFVFVAYCKGGRMWL